MPYVRLRIQTKDHDPATALMDGTSGLATIALDPERILAGCGSLGDLRTVLVDAAASCGIEARFIPGLYMAKPGGGTVFLTGGVDLGAEVVRHYPAAKSFAIRVLHCVTPAGDLAFHSSCPTDHAWQRHIPPPDLDSTVVCLVSEQQ